MEIKTTQRVNPKLKKLINQSTNEVINVEIDEVEGNVLEEGTKVTEILSALNFKGDEGIQFAQLPDNLLPTSNNFVQIVLKTNGELWCIPPIESSVQAFKINDATTGEYLANKGVQFASGSNLTYYNTSNKLNLFATRARLGAIPARAENIDKYDDGTYIDFNNTGTIKFVINGNVCHELTSEKAELSHNGSEIRIGQDGKVYLRALEEGKGLLLEGNTFRLSSNNSHVEEADNATKFNCHTSLDKASYGNSKFRLQFYEDYVRLRNIENETDIITINSDGSVEICDEYAKTFASKLANALNNKLLITSYTSKTADLDLNNDSNIYEILFSDTEDGELMKIVIKGTDIDTMNSIWMPETNNYYCVHQYVAQDDSEDSYVEVRKETEAGTYIESVYIRAIYKL